jgi:hypothetical protein
MMLTGTGLVSSLLTVTPSGTVTAGVFSIVTPGVFTTSTDFTGPTELGGAAIAINGKNVINIIDMNVDFFMSPSY